LNCAAAIPAAIDFLIPITGQILQSVQANHQGRNSMIKVAILYPNTSGSTFDAAYYRDQHLGTLARRLLSPELQGIEVDVGVAGAKGAAPFHAIGYLTFKSMEDFQQAFARGSKELGADVPKYTNLEPTLQISSYEKLL
jgi:uncharacterized protein (TIGR02118 family)